MIRTCAGVLLWIFLHRIYTESSFTSPSPNNCSPQNSMIETRVKTVNNKSCYFPFMHLNVSYSDCAVYGKSTTKFCPTTCNLQTDYEFSLCRWEKKNVLDTTCANLTSAKPNPEPSTESGKMCVFPFVYGGKCYNDCTNQGASKFWCGNTASVDLNPTEFSYCVYNLSTLNLPGCENISNAKPQIHPENTGVDLKCIFPFFYGGKCYDDCIDIGESDYWCSYNKVYQLNKWGYCKYFRDFKKYKTNLEFGVYEIYSNCSRSPLCGAPVVAANISANTQIYVSRRSSQYSIGTWEILPQPGNSILIRTPRSCSFLKHYVWSYSADDRLILSELKQFNLNTRFILNIHPSNSSLFSLSSITGKIPEPLASIGFQSSSNDNRDSILLEKIPLPVYWSFQLIKELNMEEPENSCSLQTTEASTQSTTGKSAQIDASSNQNIATLQTIVYVTLACIVVTLVGVVVTIILHCRH